MAQKMIVPPAILPVDVSEAKEHERIDVNDAANDLLIEQQLKAATMLAEEFTRRAFITQTWTYQTTCIKPILEIPRPRLQSVSDVTFTNWNNQVTNIDPSTYFIDTIYEPGRLIFKPGSNPFPFGWGFFGWTGWGWGGFLSLEFVAGYGDTADDVPWEIKEAILQIFGFLYQNREGQPIPCGSVAHTLLSPFKVEYL